MWKFDHKLVVSFDWHIKHIGKNMYFKNIPIDYVFCSLKTAYFINIAPLCLICVIVCNEIYFVKIQNSSLIKCKKTIKK